VPQGAAVPDEFEPFLGAELPCCLATTNGQNGPATRHTKPSIPPPLPPPPLAQPPNKLAAVATNAAPIAAFICSPVLGVGEPRSIIAAGCIRIAHS
jgi:hypothetical protein